MNRPAIVVIAYNRQDTLKRLLASLEKAEYGDYKNNPVTLCISVDKSDNPEVLKLAESYEWQYGEKKVRSFTENQGLKKHVLSCMELSLKYKSIIILEDDLYVSQGFYAYTEKALEFAKDDESIAGISLYNHLFNVHVREPFEAIDDGYDNWYFQFASSWGQAITDKQYAAFKEWLEAFEKRNDKESCFKNAPLNVASWGDKSWLKYHILYMIMENKYFMYPRISLTTNFSTQGTHKMGQEYDLQVPLLNGIKEYNLSSLVQSEAVYDSFFENIKIGHRQENIKQQSEEAIGADSVKWSDTEIDLYGYKASTGYKAHKKRYILSSAALPYKKVLSYKRCLRPLDMNILENVSGDDFILYDTTVSDKAPKMDMLSRIFYNYRAFKAKYIPRIIKGRLSGR